MKVLRIICLLSIILFLNAAPLVHADEASSGNILMKPLGDQVVNGYFIVEGNPGDQKQVTVNLSNSSDKASADGVFMLADAPNAVGGGIGAIDPEHNEQKQVGSWFKVNKQNIQMKPGESRDLILDFTIPSGVGPGDHVGAITLYKLEPGNKSEKPLNKNEAAVVVNKAFSQIIAVVVKVPGTISHKLEIKSLEPKMNGSKLFMDLTIVNKGNIIEDTSQGVIQISQGGKLQFEKKAEMKSIYPGNSAVFSFEAPVELINSGKYDTNISWSYGSGSGKQEEHSSIQYDISSKDVKQAQMTELVNQGNKNISKNAIVLNPKDIWRMLAIAGAALIFISIIIWMVKRKKKTRTRSNRRSRSHRSNRPYPNIEG
ncbi:DUF916 domain-containing protein [Paenibacillus sp. GP183]|uniref:COG1470 family protein n=1 Tax=Paenibacillus sp. GP183 TaxID=1882751 RepID=UPI00089BC92C|nr:DUF916 domain-containing protein [Paenibacillus sp. GP183]SEC04790.1 protein of unknown function [Paenibacillus sp. GP183]